MLELLGLQQRFGRQQALHDVHLHVAPGDAYGLIGPNGAGKTTALRIALGLQRPRRGVVLVDGFDALRFPREARFRVAGLIESPGFHPSLDGRTNLRLLARLQGIPRRASTAEVERVLELTGLAWVDRRAVRGYSHGMRQRLGIAQALLGQPRYLLLDEPTDGLDPDGIAEMRRLLRRLSREAGLGVLVSSHQLHELGEICTRIGLMRQGQLWVEADTSTLLGAASGRYALRTRDEARAKGALTAAGIAATALEAGGLLVELGAQDPAAVARELVAAGHELLLFAPRPRTLEEVYLERSAAAARDPVPAPRAAALAAPAAPRQRLAPRGALRRVLRHEAERWVRAPGLWILTALPAAIAALAVAARALESRQHAAEVAQGQLASTTSATAFEGMALVLRGGVPVLALVALAIASQSVAGELGRGTLRWVLLRPLTRGELAAGKALAAVLLALASYALLLATGFLAAVLAFDFEDLTEILPNGRRMSYLAAGELWPPLLRALWSPLPGLLAYAVLGTCLSAVVRGPVLALGLALFAWLGLDWGRGVARALQRLAGSDLRWEALLPSTYLPSPFGDTSYVEYAYQSALGVSNVTYAWASTEWVVPLAWTVVALAVTVLAVRRRSVP